MDMHLKQLIRMTLSLRESTSWTMAREERVLAPMVMS